MHARCNVPPLSKVGNLNVSVSSDNGVTFPLPEQLPRRYVLCDDVIILPCEYDFDF